MSRYIDADNLILETVEVLEYGGDDGRRPYSRRIKVYSKKQIDEAPTADVVEVVHCKDCIHYRGYYSKNEVLHCGVFDWLSLPYDYCSTGERREE